MTERAHFLGVLVSLTENLTAHRVEAADAFDELRAETHLKVERLARMVLERLDALERAADARHAEVLAALATRERS